MVKIRDQLTYDVEMPSRIGIAPSIGVPNSFVHSDSAIVSNSERRQKNFRNRRIHKILQVRWNEESSIRFCDFHLCRIRILESGVTMRMPATAMDGDFTAELQLGNSPALRLYIHRTYSCTQYSSLSSSSVSDPRAPRGRVTCGCRLSGHSLVCRCA